jgi:hypothetical protein
VLIGYHWELYTVNEDPNKSEKPAAKMPGKFNKMQDLFYVGAQEQCSAARQFIADALEHAAPEPDVRAQGVHLGATARRTAQEQI